MDAVAALAEDPLRTQLLDAAARVFAAKGYSGTKIQDIVREAGLSTGAVYGRFGSKDELLREAVIAQRARFAQGTLPPGMRVAELIERLAALSDAPLAAAEAVRLEAFVTARREPDVAEAVAEAQRDWRAAVQPLVDKAVADGTVAPDVDPEAVLYFVRTVHLGLLLQRGAGITGPDPAGWNALISRIVASFGDKGEP
ncbi:MAG TPA: TetR/AcrR family transcriptional regulator [Acidimicrobiales bacterium]|nr:TetR/AcrR family transcriptional regulator [Acidimicrobiales bacterium]